MSNPVRHSATFHNAAIGGSVRLSVCCEQTLPVARHLGGICRSLLRVDMAREIPLMREEKSYFVLRVFFSFVRKIALSSEKNVTF